MIYLTKTTSEFVADTEEEANQLIQEAKENNMFVLKKYQSVYKEVKSKGEVIDEYYLVTLVAQFNDPKAPDSDIEMVFRRKGAWEEE